VPVWAVIAIVVGALLLVAALAGGAWLGWRAYERRVLLRLVVRTEAVEAVAQALEDVLTRLAEGADAELTAFANDPESGERRALHEVRRRAEILKDELDHMPLPRRFTPLAEALADGAFMVAREAGLVPDDATGAAALDAVARINLDDVRGYVTRARFQTTEECEAWGLEETNVYGGGLYL
jgi:hypothetical protein